VKRWEYCDVTWRPDELIVTSCSVDEEPVVETYDSINWPQVLAQMGADGWELVSTTASPVGVHEYYFYFKRPLEQ
jgi:hypothetical protein